MWTVILRTSISSPCILSEYSLKLYMECLLFQLRWKKLKEIIAFILTSRTNYKGAKHTFSESRWDKERQLNEINSEKWWALYKWNKIYGCSHTSKSSSRSKSPIDQSRERSDKLHLKLGLQGVPTTGGVYMHQPRSLHHVLKRGGKKTEKLRKTWLFPAQGKNPLKTGPRQELTEILRAFRPSWPALQFLTWVIISFHFPHLCWDIAVLCNLKKEAKISTLTIIKHNFPNKWEF